MTRPERNQFDTPTTRLRAWNERVNRLIRRVRYLGLSSHAKIAPRINSLLHKRDGAIVKLHKRIALASNPLARREYFVAEEEMRVAWNSAILAIDSVTLTRKENP